MFSMEGRYLVARERYKDLLREAERQRLVRLTRRSQAGGSKLFYRLAVLTEAWNRMLRERRSKASSTCCAVVPNQICCTAA